MMKNLKYTTQVVRCVVLCVLVYVENFLICITEASRQAEAGIHAKKSFSLFVFVDARECVESFKSKYKRAYSCLLIH